MDCLYIYTLIFPAARLDWTTTCIIGRIVAVLSFQEPFTALPYLLQSPSALFSKRDGMGSSVGQPSRVDFTPSSPAFSSDAALRLPSSCHPAVEPRCQRSSSL
jgi:hypothetical protein